MWIIKFIKKNDYYMDKPAFNLKGEEGNRTVIGGCLGILYVLIYIALFVYYLIQNYSDYSPTISNYSIAHSFEQDESVIIDKNIFEFAYAFYETGENFKNLEINDYKSEVKFIHEQLGDNYEYKPTDIGSIKKCPDLTPDELAEHLPYQRMLKINKNLLCDELQEDPQFSGNFLDHLIRNQVEATLDINLCSIPEIGNDICNNRKKLEDFSLDKDLRWTFGFKNSHLTTEKPVSGPDNGYVNFSDYIEQDFDLSLDHVIVVTLQINNIETDNNFIFDFFPHDVTTFYTLKAQHSLVPRALEVNNLRIKVVFELDKYEVNNTRSYVKFDSIIANIQAVTYLMDVFFMYIVSVFNFGKLDKLISNIVYQIKPNKSSNELKFSKFPIRGRGSSVYSNETPITKKIEIKGYSSDIPIDSNDKEILDLHGLDSKKQNNLESVNRPIKIKNFNQEEVIKPINTYAEDIIKLNLKREEIKIGLLDRLLIEFGLYSKENKNRDIVMYRIASAYLSKDLDVITYLNNMQDYEKLRDYLLTKDEKLRMILESKREISSNMNAEEVENNLESLNDRLNNVSNSLVEEIKQACYNLNSNLE
jgi:hypothetical protein